MKPRTILTYIIIIAVIIGGVAYGSFRYLFGGLQKDTAFQGQLDKLSQDLPESKELTSLDDAKIQNIAIFGIDSESGDQGRSDATMIISLDNEHNKIKITSIARDSLVYIPQRNTREKLTHAYSYGGASLAVATINKNYNTNISDYVAVNFSEMAKIVDLVGGVEVNLSQEECSVMGYSDLQPGASVTLNGEQAVAYSRIRYIDSDIVRASRQREVLESLFTKARAMKKTEYPALIKSCMELCTTSLDYTELVSMASILTNSKLELEQFSCPADISAKTWGGIMDSGAWCWVYNTRAASKEILQFIYEDLYDEADPKLPKATVTTDILSSSEWSRNVN